MFGPTLQMLEPGRQYKAVIPQKIPIGGSVRGTKKPGLFKVYVPTRDGVTLEIKTTAGTCEVSAPSGGPVKDAAGKMVEPAKELRFTLPEGVFGWFGVIVRDSTSYEVSVKLTIQGHAREKDGSPIVPWNFYYYPFKDIHDQGANHPSAKWQKHFGTPANDWEKTSYWKSTLQGMGGSGYLGHGITREYVEEYNRWAGSKVVDYENTWWWGHCDAASVASAIFQQPRATGGFSEADLEYFATEIAMRGYAIDLQFFLGGLDNDNRRHPSHTEKPEDRPGQALDADIGPFHEAIINVVKKRGSVALIDMRAEWTAGKDASPDVWNQATYKFTMEAKQAQADAGPETEDATARAIEWKTVLYANADAHDSHGNPENPAGSGWNRELFYVLHFDGAGKAVVNHPQNNFKKCTWSKTGKEYYAPRYIFEIKGLNPGRQGPGNPHVTLQKAATLGLTLRPAFRV